MEPRFIPAVSTNPPPVKSFLLGRKGDRNNKTQDPGRGPATAKAPTASSPPPRGVRPIVIFPTPSPKAGVKVGLGLVSTSSSPTTSPTPPRDPPGISTHISPSRPLVSAGVEPLRQPHESTNSPGSTSSGSSSSSTSEDGSEDTTPNSTPLTKAFQDTSSLRWAMSSSSSSDECIFDADRELEYIVPQEMHLTPAEMPMPIASHRAPKPQRITESECVAMFLRPDDIAAPFPAQAPTKVNKVSNQAGKRQGNLRPLLLPELVARRSNSGSSSSDSSSASSSAPNSSSSSVSTIPPPSTTPTPLSYPARCAEKTVGVEERIADPPSIVVTRSSVAPQVHELHQDSKQMIHIPSPSFGRRFKSWIGRVLCCFPSHTDGDRHT